MILLRSEDTYRITNRQAVTSTCQLKISFWGGKQNISCKWAHSRKGFKSTANAHIFATFYL